MTYSLNMMDESLRDAVISDIEKHKVIVIIRGVYGEELYKTAQAVYDGGVRLMEITFDATGKISESETSMMISELIKKLPNDTHIGSGTVIDVSKVEATRRGGGRFIISPDTNEEVIKRTRELGMVSIPGAITPSEVCNAHRYGADFVKLFPAGNFGPAYIKAIKAPLSHIKLLAVGGIEAVDLQSYEGTGVSGFGVGSPVIKLPFIKSGEYDKITALAKAFVDNLKSIKSL